VLVVACVTLMARSSLADHYHVPSGSMRPTVAIGDRVVVNKAAYGLRIPWSERWLLEASSPERGDVVVLRSPEDGRVLLKRVVAVAGDEVAVRDGAVFVGGDAIAEPYRRRTGAGPDFGPTVVPARRVLVVGDNRGNSHDGRSFGFVAVDDVLGRVEATYFHDGGLTWRRLLR
jgi:signal peptidase I